MSTSNLKIALFKTKTNISTLLRFHKKVNIRNQIIKRQEQRIIITLHETLRTVGNFLRTIFFDMQGQKEAQNKFLILLGTFIFVLKVEFLFIRKIKDICERKCIFKQTQKFTKISEIKRDLVKGVNQRKPYFLRKLFFQCLKCALKN